MTIKVEISADGKEIDVVQKRNFSGLHEEYVHIYTLAEARKLLKYLNRLIGECPQE